MMNQRDFSLFDHFDDGVQFLCAEFRYRYLNDSVIVQSGKKREELLGKTMMEAYPGVEETWIFRAIREAMLSGRAVRTTNDFSFPDGSTRYFQLRIQPCCGGVVIFSSDITEEQAHLVLMESMAYNARDVEQIARAVAFELQAPLRAVQANIALVGGQCRGSVDAELLARLDDATHGVERMRALTKVILEHALLGIKTVPERLDTAQLFGEVRQEFLEQLRRIGGEVLLDEMPTVHARAPELRLMLHHLIENAIKFRARDTPLRIRVSATQRGHSWEFAVADNGIGIERQHHSAIFRIFRRLHTEAEYGGLGVGLSYCEKIARLHGGKIWVESSPGEGSTFRFTLGHVQV